MKFYGNGVVWDGENNKALCRFKNGILETEDERVSEILIKAGYKHDPFQTKKDIMALLDAKGIEYNSRDKKEVLQALWEEGE